MNSIVVKNHSVDVISLNTVIVGAGAAALNAADRLYSYGIYDLAIICEDLKISTSRNTGSDKQTYYKLGLSGNESDSVMDLTKTLMSGQCVDGDIALAEAANSATCFLRLCELGVPFPTNRYGEYIGYKTDHDPKRRATSAGPLTSKIMTECLEKSVLSKNIPVYSGLQVIAILTDQKKVYGLLCLNLHKLHQKEKRFVAFHCENVIYATGGPAGMYADSVYPEGQFGASGIAFEAGVRGKNLTEWQYGLASVSPRWNVSGTYMQVLPRFISTDVDGLDEREFLYDEHFDKADILNYIFLKGYQWPFDVRKAVNGSSLIDIFIYVESCLKGRRVFLDYRSNSAYMDFAFLNPEAKEYLDKSGALFGKPVDRLIHMNAPAYDFYLSRGIDLKHDPLEIALCAQHNNGGLSIDCWWQTNIEGFFAAGEVCASHGVYRPGGSALNAGQVGSMRAAQYISKNRHSQTCDIQCFENIVRKQMTRLIEMSEQSFCDADNVNIHVLDSQMRMSKAGAAVRSLSQISKAIAETKDVLINFGQRVKIGSVDSLPKLYRYYDILLSQYVYLSAMKDYLEHGGRSRGSALYYDEKGTKPSDGLPEQFRFSLDDGSMGGMVQEVSFANAACTFCWREVRPIPADDDFFENVWKTYRENGNVY